jgi:hypothetical protein
VRIGPSLKFRLWWHAPLSQVAAVTSLMFVLSSKLRGNGPAERPDDVDRASSAAFDSDTEEETWLRENV